MTTPLDMHEFPEIRPIPSGGFGYEIPDDDPRDARGRHTRQQAPAGPQPIQASRFIWQPPECLPRRKWLYGFHYIRRFVSCTISPGGVGKTALGIVEALSIVTGRALLGVAPSEETRVWIWNGEDPLEELNRRITAACMHYGIDPSELDGRLFVNSGRETEIVIAEQTKSGATIMAPVVEQIVKTISEHEIGLLIIDPFVSSHRVTENDNNAIDRVVKTWAKIADETNCAIELVHHSRKTGGAEVTVEDGRGAVALLGAARSARALNGMTQEEAERAEVDNRKLFFKVENGKANLVISSDKANWHRLASVSLGNGEGGTPGDSMGVVTAWEWPDPFASITFSDLQAAQKAVSAGGPWRENPQAGDWVGKPIAEALKLDPANKAHKRKVLALLKRWMDNGMFKRVGGKDSKRMEKVFVEVGEWA
jgi:hypothetical protein